MMIIVLCISSCLIGSKFCIMYYNIYIHQYYVIIIIHPSIIIVYDRRIELFLQDPVIDCRRVRRVQTKLYQVHPNHYRPTPPRAAEQGILHRCIFRDFITSATLKTNRPELGTCVGPRVKSDSIEF